MDTPSWADLTGFKPKDEDSDDEFFRVIFQIIIIFKIHSSCQNIFFLIQAKKTREIK